MKILSISIISWLMLVGSCSNERYTTKISNLKKGILVTDSLEISTYSKTITIDELKTHLYEYASKEFNGRAAGSEGQRKAAKFIKDYYISQGIASPISDSTYFQSIPSSYFNETIKGSENVLAYIKGSEKPEEVIVISAHLDHEGAKDGKIYYGADDDGSGTVAVMEIAQAFKIASDNGSTPKRSILFLHVTAEEIGLEGSRYYTENPVFPLENTICNLNIDMIGRVDQVHENNKDYIYLIGSDRLSKELHHISERVNESFTNLELDYTFNAEDDRNRFYYRSDHYNFAKNNIPVIFYFNGVHEDYHQPTDTPDKITYEQLQKRAQLIFATAWHVANMETRLVVDNKD
ncbi:MAG: M28 family peptidase [Bacteroidia bacterium]|nr:M28 family peptidase [Bacteroidia bacterium]MBT8309998.1 M28 family peptidase [Bacteroidia bacterium]NNL61223.1 M28 family peptidase [Flavobacteriaceae bacterium]RZV65784.1 MAG: M28 family peptidase [Flavobacteriaceae bacterium]